MVLAVVIPTHAHAQPSVKTSPDPSTASDQWVRPAQPSGPMTRAQIDAAIVGYWASSHDSARASDALDFISTLIQSGEMNTDSSDAVHLLEVLAEEGTREQVRSGGATVNDFPLIRARAVRLLGRMRGAQALAVVLRISVSDPSPDVRGAAVIAMTRLVQSPSDRELSALKRVLQTNNEIWNNARLAYTTLSALKTFYLRSSRPEAPGLKTPMNVAPNMKDPSLFRAVAETALGPYPLDVRVLAASVLNSMRDATNR